jgi:hypothetical protein
MVALAVLSMAQITRPASSLAQLGGDVKLAV